MSSGKPNFLNLGSQYSVRNSPYLLSCPKLNSVQQTESMGRKARTILAHSHGLESKKISGRRRSVSLDSPFYRTYQVLAVTVRQHSRVYSGPRVRGHVRVCSRSHT